MDLRGKVCVVTGASRGIGAALAGALAEAGAKVGLCARQPCQLPAGSEGVTAALDVADAEAVAGFADEVASQLGIIDLWVNNAGVLAPVAPLRDIDPAAFVDHLRINVMGVVHGSQAYIAHLRRVARDRRGVLINISSGAAWQGYAGWAPYCASKAAVERISEAIQLEEEAVLRCHAVAPGIVDTDMQALIRSCTPEQFPMVEQFRAMKASGSFNSLPFVARELLRVAFDPAAEPDKVSTELPSESAP
ncbi:MAG: SDR family oxidoreductase [Haliangiales bacterium]